MSKKQIRHWYLYEGGAEQLPVWFVRLVKKLTRRGEGVTYRNGNWVTKRSREYAQQIAPNATRVAAHEFRQTDTLLHLTQRKNALLEQTSQRHLYRFDDMLVITDPYNKAPLTALLLFYTTAVCKVRYTVKGRNRATDYVGESALCKEHKVAVYGLYPAKNNKVTVTLLDADNHVLAERVIWIPTKELPMELAHRIRCDKRAEQSAYPFVMITGGHEITTCAFDTDGVIRYYLTRRPKAYGIFPLNGRHFLYTEKYISIPSYFVPQGVQFYDMNYLGGVVGMYLTPNGIHHAACEMTSGGNFLCCASVFDKDAENAIVEIDRKTGSVVSVLDFQTIFDERVQQIASWAHVNSICYMPKEHAVVASLRNIHAVVKVDWNTKEVIWLLSQPELWRDSVLADKRLQPQGQVEWFFMQHAAVQLEEDFDDCAHTVHVMVYDNHVAYRRPTEYYDGDMEHSFIVTYTIDEQAMTVQMEQRLPVEKSTMRSNAVLEYDKNRLFHMGGNRVAQGRDADGVIEEYNYETGECLSRYTVETGFFSAYRFAPDSALLEIEPMRTDTAVLGHPPLLRQMPLPWGADTAQDVLPDAEVLDVYLQEDIFYLRSRSNAVKGVYFAGQSDTYGIRFIENANPDKLVDEVMQTIPIRLDTLAAGTYDLYVDMGEHRYRKPACLVMQ